MADVDVTSGAVTGHPTRRGRKVPYLVQREVTGAAAVAAKGSALASSDVVQAIDVPANSVVLAAGLNVTTADTGTAAPTDVSVGSTDFVSAAALTTTGGKPSVDAVAAVYAADTVDLVLGTLSSAGDDWVVSLWAVICDCSDYVVPTEASGFGTNT